MITIRFSFLENQLRSGISELVSIDSEIIDRLLAGDRFVDLYNKFENIVIYKLNEKGLFTEERKRQIKKLRNYLDKKRITRNDNIHSQWTINNEGLIVRS
jgi:hypothetical protein